MVALQTSRPGTAPAKAAAAEDLCLFATAANRHAIPALAAAGLPELGKPCAFGGGRLSGSEGVT